MAFKINEHYGLEGTQFDWTLIRYVEGKDKDGNPKVQERKHYFPRLSQIASYIVEEETKATGNVKAFVSAVERSTAAITEKLAGIEERLSAAGNTVSIEGIADGEVERNEEKDKAAPAVEQPAKRRTRKKKAS